LVFGTAGVLLAITAWLKRFGTEIAVTDRRVIYKTGLIRRHTTEINMDKIESVDVDQSVLGRMFGYGTVTIRGTGEAVEPLRDIADPIAFRKCHYGSLSRTARVPLIPPRRLGKRAVHAHCRRNRVFSRITDKV
jgi:uncharacterized membrane protein YdbT with pleckstrin-like domain